MILSLLVAAVFSSAAVPVCHFQSVAKDCDYLKQRQTEQFISLPDGTWFRNPAYDLSAWRRFMYTSQGFQKVSSERRKKVRELVVKVRRSLENSIIKGRNESDLSVIERSQLKRLRTVRYQDSNENCVSLGPNAHYNPGTHSFTICDSAMHQPDSQLAFVIGHELGHALDPCQMSLDLIQVKGGENPSYRLYSEALVPYLASKTPISESSIVDRGLSGYARPHSETIECLNNKLGNRVTSDQYDAGAKILTDAVIKEMTPQERADPDNSAANIQARQRYVMNKYPACFSRRGLGNPMSEYISDAWGARALGEFLKERPPNGDLERLSVFSAFLPQLCAFVKKAADSGESHPPSLDRWNQIVFANHEVQKAFGCRPEGHVCGDHEYSPRSNDPAISDSTR